ncbi:MAG: DUF554 domain-containing protein [Clostridia bacterium]|nr:DUF554 domain-containing protein [Clostridia bacterium]
MKFLTDHFLGTMVNFAVVLLLGILGSLIKRGLPKRITDAVMAAVGACVVYIGIDGMLEAAPAVSEECVLSAGLFKALVMILSMAVGTLIGELIDIDKWIKRLGDYLASRIRSADGGENFSAGFVSCSLLFCIGAMTINGAIADAQGDPSLLLAKSVLDGISVLIMSGTMGIGCAFSAFFILVYQGGLTLAAFGLVGVLSASTLTYMSVTGSLVIMLLGTNVMGITRVKTANMIPALFLPIAFEALLKLIFG